MTEWTRLEGFDPGLDYRKDDLSIEVLVDTSAYSDPSTTQPQWCVFRSTAAGTAAVYPVKATVPGRGEGQWRFDEVLGWRIPTEMLRGLASWNGEIDLGPLAAYAAEL